MRFRPTAVQNWHVGETQNVSATGLLLRAPHTLPVSTPVVLELQAPIPLAGAATVPVVCTGRIVRSDVQPESGPAYLAVCVESFEVRSSRPASQTDGGDARLREGVHLLTNQLAVVVGLTDLLLGNDHIDENTAARLRNIKQVALQAATTVRKLST